MKVLIVAGGSSSERKISLISARAVKEALRSLGHDATIFDYKEGRTALKKQAISSDVIFPVMHGKEGEDGTLYSFLRSLKKPYVGSDPKGARIAFDKILFKKYCDSNRIATAEWKVIQSADEIRAFGFPCVLKAASGGSSHEVALLHSEKDLSTPKVKKILKLRDSFFVERLLDGVEITVGVLLGKPLPVIEIVPPAGKWFDYKNKYSGESKEIPFAPSVSENLQRESQKIAAKIHADLRLNSYSRTDSIIKNGTPYILEINTPGGVGLTSESLFPRAAKAAGMPFPQLLDKIIKGSLKQAGRRTSR